MNEFERTTRKTVEFAWPFVLDSSDGEMPPGSYDVETDEEQIPGLSFIAYRRVRTTISPPATEQGIALQRQVLTIDPTQLETAIANDREQSLRKATSHLLSTTEDKTMTQTKRPDTAAKTGTTTAPSRQQAAQFQKHNLISSAPVLVPVLIVASLEFITWYRPAPQTAPLDRAPASVANPAR